MANNIIAYVIIASLYLTESAKAMLPYVIPE
jgi:hypothetical protein